MVLPLRQHNDLTVDLIGGGDHRHATLESGPACSAAPATADKTAASVPCIENRHVAKAFGSEHVPGMSDRDDFLTWVNTTLYEAELALHNGDAAPRRALWSLNEPVSVLGAWRNAFGQQDLDKLFASLGRASPTARPIRST